MMHRLTLPLPAQVRDVPPVLPPEYKASV